MISPRWRRILPGLLLAWSLTATGTATAAAADGQAPTAQASPRKAGSVDPNGLTGVPAPGKTRPATMTPGESCGPTPAGSRERKAGAVKGCVTSIATPAAPAGRKSLAAAPQAAPAAAADSGSCALAAPRTWYYNRFAYCVHGLTVLYTLKDSNDKEIGTGTLDVSSSAVLPAKGTTWSEFVRVTMTGATGAVTTLSVRFRPACSAGCKVTKSPRWTGKTIIKDQVLNGDVVYESTPAPGTKVDFTTSYELFVTSPGAQITDPNASWSNPEKIRCDDAVRDTTTSAAPDPGCVVPSYMPVVKMSDQPTPQGAGAAAAGYLWAQSNLPDGWGRAKPLTRAKGDVAGRTARTCGTFQARTDLVSNDSCGEFPFAVTREGGTDGAQCAEILPRHSTRGGWVTDVLDGGTSSPCARAHVPLADKQAAEAQLAEGFENQRVVEDDQFKVEISGSIAEPQAVCRQNAPAGSVPSGNGWIKNTTAPVPHVNKTVPLSPAGTRAERAQACLGIAPPKGTEAEGDITGWADADAFRTANSTTAGLARCHLIPNVLGGKGGKNDGGPDNLVPCWQSGMNTGTPSMRTYEAVAQRAAREVKDGGILGPNDAIFYQVTPDYLNSDSTIPQAVTMSARVERSDGTSQPLFPDVYITNTQKNTGQLNLGN
ncbi:MULTISPECIES: DNA/RNA non-specific endonuclease [unclassified Streptomyces]|uniref:DNA/RNA non-specific endonuclease n=1 Tax=unclassified Streptomyces TaxID=2593676 RepID=UPI002E10959E|nr:DNA/RNA non-specific endonuclease [Streptomyces sp. NBC_01205]